MEIKIMIVVGARPNFMKAAPIIAAIKQYNTKTGRGAFGVGTEDRRVDLRHFLVHTGQHYDELMSEHFFTDLNLPKPDKHLGAGSGSHAVQTAEIIKKFDECLTEERPDVLIVVGDVNSTLACALVAAKASFNSAGTRPLICHVEAGLRSFDRAMPEEVNRVVTDQLSDLLFVTEESGIKNLQREGFSQDKIHFVGNTMIDSLLAFKEVAEKSQILERLGLRKREGNNGSGNSILPYALLTIHRPSNVDNCDGLCNIIEGMEDLRANYPIIFPAHPRTQKRIREFGLERYFVSGDEGDGRPTPPSQVFPHGIRIIPPLGYLDFLCLMKHAKLVVTDSGGVQEETTCLGVPCVTVRENTERPITVDAGTNVIAGVRKEGIREAIKLQENAARKIAAPEKWDGHTAERIVEIICRAASDRRASASRIAERVIVESTAA
jgi:UDP-N-acetylglucosamine 2-epimerase (non-hydrolysing)